MNTTSATGDVQTRRVSETFTNSASGTARSSSQSSTGSTGILRARRRSRRKRSTVSSSSSSDPPMNNSENGSGSSSPNEHENKQNRKVALLRAIVIVTLLSATVVVAVLVYKYVKSEQANLFATQYSDSVAKVADAFQAGIDTKHDAASTFSAIYTSIYGNTVQNIEGGKTVWPNATLPFFAEKATDLLKISNGRALSFNPIITQDVNRLEWEAHVAESAWLLGDVSLVVPNPIFTFPSNRTVSFGIYSRDADRNVVYDPGFAPDSRYEDHLVPVWQIYPIKTNEKAVMFNLHSEKNRQR